MVVEVNITEEGRRKKGGDSSLAFSGAQRKPLWPSSSLGLPVRLSK